MATFEEHHQSILAIMASLKKDWMAKEYDGALSDIDDIKGDLEHLEEIVAQRFVGETS